MDIANIRAFVAVATTGSFSEAAKSLNLTQPAISKRVALLEHELGENLFNRLNRQIILTEAGEILLPKCQLILETINDSLMSLQNLSGKVQGKLSIGTSHHIGLHRLPTFLRTYTQHYPQVNLDIHFMGSEQICEQVEYGGLELGIITLPDSLPANLYSRMLWNDELIFVVGKTHVLAKNKNISLTQIAEHEALLPEENTYTRDIIENAFTINKLKLKTKLKTNYLETLKMMVSVGLGWSVLPKTMLDKELVPLQINDIILIRKLGYIQHKHRTLSNAALAMLSLLKNQNSA